MLDAQLEAALAAREARGTRRRLLLGDADAAARLAQCIDLSSNDYLSLARAEAPRARVAAAVRAGAALGSTGSRLLDGDSRAHTALETRLAAYFGAPAALLFNSGFDANVSLLATLPQPGDVVVYDALVHASMHDGMRASRARACCAFAHNDPAALDAALASAAPLTGNVFLALEAVYSMDGTVCRVRELAAVLARHVPDAARRCVLVDEAHAVGVYGARGTGLVAALGAADAVDVRLVTFGKALGCAGAAVLCRPLFREYLLNYARPLIYSTALAPLSVAAVDAMLDALEREPERQHTLHALAAHLQRAGFLVRGVTYPTVPRGEERVRICVHAHNTDAEMDALAAEIARWARTHGAPAAL
ncbi:8-amino-7-oxononanoate synthase [Malassezia obtusa]|uniref:8-amino-7-oxononanoate synthase n=1 Tax=Malassezia obtusa TaxID=76774 RepID=A0AAF0E0S7_9BASI|nr:8-amino-7-oxononanoate synthase [Malassezia obtusa]